MEEGKKGRLEGSDVKKLLRDLNWDSDLGEAPWF